MSVRELRTARLLLRPFGRADEDALYRLWNDLEVRRYLSDDKPVPRETVRSQIERSRRSFTRRGFGLFTVSLPPDESIIGSCGLLTIADPEQVEVLYALLPEYWGRGLATEAARAALRFGFEEVGLTEIYTGSDQPNAASLRVIERLGMSLVGERQIRGLSLRYYRIRREEFSPDPGPFVVHR